MFHELRSLLDYTRRAGQTTAIAQLENVLIVTGSTDFARTVSRDYCAKSPVVSFASAHKELLTRRPIPPLVFDTQALYLIASAGSKLERRLEEALRENDRISIRAIRMGADLRDVKYKYEIARKRLVHTMINLRVERARRGIDRFVNRRRASKGGY